MAIPAEAQHRLDAALLRLERAIEGRVARAREEARSAADADEIGRDDAELAALKTAANEIADQLDSTITQLDGLLEK
ncbi:MAG: hypothetical protein ACFB3T_11835 [Geminicoccaceae bacterium]